MFLHGIDTNLIIALRALRRNPMFTVVALLLSLASDASYSYANLWSIFPAYIALAFHAVASIALEQTQGVFPPSVTPQMITASSALGSCFLAVPLYAFRTFMVGPVFRTTIFRGPNLVSFSLRTWKPHHCLCRPSPSFHC